MTMVGTELEPTRKNTEQNTTVEKKSFSLEEIKQCFLALDSYRANEAKKKDLLQNKQIEKLLNAFIKNNKYVFDEWQKEKDDLLREHKKFIKKIDDQHNEINKIIDEKQKLRETVNDLQEQNEELKKKLIDQESKINNLKNEKGTLDKKKIQKEDGFIYLAATKKYAAQQIFKLGLTGDLKNRLKSYNTGRTSEDRFYYGYYRKVSNMRYVEKILQHVLQDFRDSIKNEFFKFPFQYLKKIIESTIDNINQGVTIFDKIIRDEKIDKLLSMRGKNVPEEKIEENGGLSKLELINGISNLLNRYGENGRLVINRKQLFKDLAKELNLEKLKKSDTWDLMKQQFKWKSGKEPIFYGDYSIKIEYY